MDRGIYEFYGGEEKMRNILEKLMTSKTRTRILAYLFFEKDRVFIREMSSKLKISPSAIKGELENLLSIGIVKKEDNLFVLDSSCNFLEDLRQVFIKTDFIYSPIKEALGGLKVEFALVFGSFANGNFKNESDIDVLFIGNVTLEEIYKRLRLVESKIGKDINPICWDTKALVEKRESALIRDILKKKIIMLIGEEDEFRKLIKK